MSRILCVAVVMSALAGAPAVVGPALAGMSEGVAAVTVGDYPKAIAEFQPLAAGGDPAAQYQLAKIYLEGHGPADGVPQGIELMTKAANGGYPEAQAQLGLMYAMGLGVPVDNVKAYDWLSKAVGALPDGTRRTVAEANRDAVLKRMNASQQNAVAAAMAPDATDSEPAAAPQTAAKVEAAKVEAAKVEAAKVEAAKVEAAQTKQPEAKPAAATSAATTVTEAAKVEAAKVEAAPAKQPEAKPAAATDATKTATKTATEAAQTKQPETKPATGEAASAASQAKPASAESKVAKTDTKPAASDTKPAAIDSKPTATAAATGNKPTAESGASAAGTSTQVASAKAPDSAAADKQAPSGVRIQLISMPSEAAAWDAWKQLSGKYSAQLSGLTPVVETADLGTKGTFYRVQTGPFDSVAKAQERCSAMKQAGLDCLVVGRP